MRQTQRALTGAQRSEERLRPRRVGVLPLAATHMHLQHILARELELDWPGRTRPTCRLLSISTPTSCVPVVSMPTSSTRTLRATSALVALSSTGRSTSATLRRTSANFLGLQSGQGPPITST